MRQRVTRQRCRVSPCRCAVDAATRITLVAFTRPVFSPKGDLLLGKQPVDVGRALCKGYGLPAKYDIDARQDLLQGLRSEFADALSQVAAINREELRCVGNGIFW